MSTVTPPPIAPQPQSSGSGKIVIIVIMVVLLVLTLACGGVLVALLIPAVSASRSAARQMMCSNNMRSISLALSNYETVYKSFPPAYTEDENGNRLHSWRTLILPYMEQNGLYLRVDLSKPWDDPANAFLADTSISAFACDAAGLQPGMTTYVAAVDPQGIFSGTTPTKLPEISDGTSNTLLFVEVDSARAVHWASPEDADLLTFTSSLSDPTHQRGANVAMADGSIQFFESSTDPAAVGGMLTKDGGELIAF